MSRYEGERGHRGRGGGGRDRGGGGYRGGRGEHPAQAPPAPAAPAPAASHPKEVHHAQTPAPQHQPRGGGGGTSWDREWYYGLYTFTNGNAFHPLPAKAVSIYATLNSISVEVTVVQKYVNSEKHLIDATFIFPVPYQAAVREFEATFDDQVVIGQVREKTRSQTTEPDHGSTTVFLLEQQERLQLKAVVPNWAPGKELKFKVTYLADVLLTPDWSDATQHRLKFLVPAKLIPSIKKREGEKRDPFKVELHVDFDFPTGVSEIETNVATVTRLRDLQRGSITLGSRVFSLPHDFLAYLKLANYSDRAVVEVDSKGSCVIAVEFYPPLPRASRGGGGGDRNAEKDSASDDEGETSEKLPPGESSSLAEKSSQKRGKWDRSQILAELSLATEPAALRSAVVGLPNALYDNSRVLCYALLPAEHPADVPVKFIFTGKAKPGTAAKDFSVSVSANLSAAVSGFRLHALYGKAHIRELEQSGAAARQQQQQQQKTSDAKESETSVAASSSASASHREEVSKAVIAAAQRFGVWLPGPAIPFASYYKKTSPDGLVSLKEVSMPPRKQRPLREEHVRLERGGDRDRGHDRRDDRSTAPPSYSGSSFSPRSAGPPPQRRPDDHPQVPHQQGRGFASDRGGGRGGRGGGGAASSSGTTHQQVQQRQQQNDRRDDGRRGSAAPAAASQAADPGHAYEPDTLFQEIARLQTAQGFWTLTRKLAEILCIEFPDLLAAIRDTHDQDRQWATSLTITFLESGLGGDAAKTGRVVALGRAWLSHHVGVEKANDWLDKAKKFIADHIEIIVE